MMQEPCDGEPRGGFPPDGCGLIFFGLVAFWLIVASLTEIINRIW